MKKVTIETPERMYPPIVQYKNILTAASPMPIVLGNQLGSGNVLYTTEMKMNLKREEELQLGERSCAEETRLSDGKS